MAHTCPECGETCYCNGDIDDILFDDDSDGAIHCIHFEKCERRDDDEDMQDVQHE